MRTQRLAAPKTAKLRNRDGNQRCATGNWRRALSLSPPLGALSALTLGRVSGFARYCFACEIAQSANKQKRRRFKLKRLPFELQFRRKIQRREFNLQKHKTCCASSSRPLEFLEFGGRAASCNCCCCFALGAPDRRASSLETRDSSDRPA